MRARSSARRSAFQQWSGVVLLLLLISSAHVFAEDITLRWATWGPQPIDRELLEVWEQEHPDIHIDYIPTAGTPKHHEKLKVLSASGLAPDVMAVDGMYLVEFITSGLLQPIDHLLAAEKTFRMSDYFPASLPDVRYKGKTYGLPYISAPQYMVYNVTHMNEAGLPKPDVHWDWAAFESYVRKLTRSVDDRITRRGSTNFSGAYSYWPWLWSAGSDVMDESHKRFRLTEPAAVEVLDWLAELQSAGCLGSGDIARQSASITAMYPGGFPTVTGKTWAFEWDVTLPPAGPKGQYSIWKGNTMGLSPATEHVEEAWTLAKFLLAPNASGYNVYLKNKRFPPQTRDRASWNLFHQAGQDPQSLRDVTLLLASDHGRPLPQLLQWPAIMTDTIHPALKSIFAGEVSARVAMEQIRPIVEKLLEVEP
jgi:ABC-type glycerol-3-phosphate transport system substrate-binding protein